jgi:hypothetical protein
MTPTNALAIRIKRMTMGSTKAVPLSLSSKRARTNEMTAEPSLISGMSEVVAPDAHNSRIHAQDEDKLVLELVENKSPEWRGRFLG